MREEEKEEMTEHQNDIKCAEGCHKNISGSIVKCEGHRVKQDLHYLFLTGVTFDEIFWF